MCLLYEIYHRVDHPINEYLHQFVAARNTRTSAALGELALVIPGCKTDQFSRSSLLATLRWNCCRRVYLGGVHRALLREL